MYFAKRPYTDDNIKDITEIKRKITDNEIVEDLYLVCRDDNSANIAEIMSCRELLNGSGKRKNYGVIGMAIGKDSAIELLRKNVLELI